MKRLLVFSISLCMLFVSQAQDTAIPDWFQHNMEESVGKWIADNAIYKNEQEPFERYVMEWEWASNNKAINGRLYGIMDGKATGNFWEFRQYWDFEKNEGIVVQYGWDGTIGIGPLKDLGDHKTEMLQVYTTPNGESNKHGHKSEIFTDSFTSASFNIEDGNWVADRSYVWKRKPNTMSMGKLSLSLAVKDISASKVFYEKLDFEVVDGTEEQKWLILKNETAKIGLFQGLFPTNTLTFNPVEARAIYKNLKNDLEIGKTNGMEKDSGACSFTIVDPDGNPILIDQH